MKHKHNQFFSAVLMLLLSALSAKAESPTITTQPQSQTAIAGSNVVFQVIASGGQSPLPVVTSGTLKLWLKADAGVIANAGGKISQWQDQSTNANHAFQVDSIKQPIFVNGAVPISAQPVVRFDGVFSASEGDFLQGNGNLGLSAGFTSFLVCSEKGPLTDDGQIPVLIGVPGQSSAVRTYYIFSPPNSMAFAAWQNDYDSGLTIPTDTFRTWTLRLNSSKTLIEFFDTDGFTNRTSSLVTGGLATPGAGYYVGGAGSSFSPYHFKGDISEIIYYQGALTETDRLAVDNYLKQKYFVAPEAGPLVYQWLFNATNIIGATNSSLLLSNVQTANAGPYSVIITNSAGSITSSVASLMVNAPPSITAQPQNQNVQSGSNATFSVTVTGTSPSYQWRFNGTTISNATDSAYSITNAQPTNSGGYSVVITNSVGSVTSVVATLTVYAPVSIVTQPQNQTVIAGTDVILNVLAAGGQPSLPLVTSGTLKLWLKADAGVIADAGGKISQWQDQSTNANHAFQVDSIKQPIFVNGAVPVSAQPAVRFDGVVSASAGDFLQGNGNVGLSAGFTSFLVCSEKGPLIEDGQIPVLIGVPGQSSAVRSYYIFSPPNKMAFAAWLNDYLSDLSIPPDTFRTWTLRLNSSKTQIEFFDTNGATNRTSSNATGGLTTPGAGYYVGGAGSSYSPYHFKGDISEIIYYQGALTESDRVAVDNYLKQKYFAAPGTGPLAYQWLFNGTNIAGATNASLALTNTQPAQSGNYTVIVTNITGSVTSTPAVVKIRYIFPLGNGQVLTNAQYSYVSSVNISFQKFFTSGMVFYTLDGSAPTFSSQSYTVPFALTNSAILRAIIYSADFSQSGESDPVNITIVPTYTLSKVPAGGGSITINGTNPFLSNTVVNVTATASNGWTFLQWLGDASGTNPLTSVTMTRNKSVRAVFGTTLSTTVAGNGAVILNPASAFYPYGTAVGITAVPDPGNYFGIWGNAASGNTNPLYFPVITPNPTVSSLFSTLSGGQFSMTVSVNGSGRVSANPRANVYNSGQNVTLTATPEAGQTFIGWSGDASGAANPLNVTMNQSRYITANFTKNPKLMARFSPSTFQSEGLQLILTGSLGEIYSLQRSTNLIDWPTIATLTNSYGTVETLDLPATNSNQQFYRAVQP